MTHAGNWAFLTNHALVLLALWQHPGITIRAVSERVGITERAAHEILRGLVASGYVTRRRAGRRNEYVIHEDRLVHHPSGFTRVGRLLQAMGLKDRRPAGD